MSSRRNGELTPPRTRRGNHEDIKQAARHSGNIANIAKRIIEIIKVRFVITNGLALWKRKAHVQLLQETLVPKGTVGKFKQQAKKHNKDLDVGPLDPEQNKAAAGVGTAAVDGLKPYRLPILSKTSRTPSPREGSRYIA